DESDIPERWYNILPDMPGPPAPYLNPQTLLPMGPADLAPIFPQAIIAQEVSAEPWIEIPDQVREIYKIWRPSPLYRADRLAKVYPSPTNLTNAGRGILKDDPDSPGGLGIAISEAVEDAATHDDAKYSLGSVVNHVLLHQTVIGQEAKKQMELAGEYPDLVIGCVGGGSNFAGLSYPFIGDTLKGRMPKTRFIAAE